MATEGQQKVLDYVGYTAAALEKADAQLADFTKQASAVQEKIPAVVDALVEHKHIREDQRKQAAEILSQPGDALDLLAKVAAHVPDSSTESPKLGEGVDQNSAEKSAAARPGDMGTLKPRDVTFFRKITGREPTGN